MNGDCINPSEIRKAIQLLKDPGELFEIRIVGGNKKQLLSGYFTDVDVLLKQLSSQGLRDKNVYISLNRIDRALYSRTQHDRFVLGPTTTSDHNVTDYEWFFVDLDPIRIADVSSTDDELAQAEKSMYAVADYLAGIGFKKPVMALSGNGYHLLYKVNFPNIQENENIVIKCMQVLADMFGNNAVKIDTVNSNPSRVCKLHGTLAQKGANTTSRPHRFSRIISTDTKYEFTDLDVLKKLAAELPDPEPPQKIQYQSTRKEFDLLEFMSQHGLTYSSTTTGAGNSTIYALDECPFDSSHKNGDAKIFHYGNGAIAFKCHHNHCRDYKWQDVRKLFEPDAYDRQPIEDDYDRIADGYAKHKALKKDNADHVVQTVKNRQVTEEITEADLDMPTLADFEEKEQEWLIPGYVPKGCVTLLCSDGGVGKTSIWCDTVAKLTSGKMTVFDKALNLPWSSQEHLDVMYFSKEDATEEVLKKRLRAAGADQKHVRLFALGDPRLEKIWYGSAMLRKLVKKYRPAFVVFDALQSFLPEGVDMAKRKDMRDALAPLNQLGAEFGTAFMLIMHTNKSSNSGRQRMADSSDIWDLGRSALMAGHTRDKDIMYLSHEKCNYGRLQKTILFSILDQNVVEFRGTTWRRDRDYMAESQIVFSSPRKDEAKEFILDQLQDGNRHEIRAIEEAAKAAGIAKSTLEDARAELVKDKKIKREKAGFATTTKWYLLLYPKSDPE